MPSKENKKRKIPNPRKREDTKKKKEKFPIKEWEKAKKEKKILCPMGMEYQKKDDDECNNDENSEKGPPTNVSKMLRKLVDGPKTNVITRQ